MADYHADLEIYKKVQAILKKASDDITALGDPDLYVKGLAPEDAISTIEDMRIGEDMLEAKLQDALAEERGSAAANYADFRRDELLTEGR